MIKTQKKHSKNSTLGNLSFASIAVGVAGGMASTILTGGAALAGVIPATVGSIIYCGLHGSKRDGYAELGKLYTTAICLSDKNSKIDIQESRSMAGGKALHINMELEKNGETIKSDIWVTDDNPGLSRDNYGVEEFGNLLQLINDDTHSYTPATISPAEIRAKNIIHTIPNLVNELIPNTRTTFLPPPKYSY